MKHCYELPPGEGGMLNVGQWVEIFEAYGSAEGNEGIRVRRMRVAGRLLHFAAAGSGSRPLRPHEGRVVFVEEGERATRFGIRLSS